MTNKQVKQAFQDRKPGHSTNLLSDGTSLWSYGWWEVARWIGDEIVVRRGSAYSTTTATKHRSGVVGTLAAVETPRAQACMNVE